jgi:hypothetical protein
VAVNRGRVFGGVRWWVPLAAVVATAALVMAALPQFAAPGRIGSHAASGVVAPGPSGSLAHRPWWDPRAS